MPLLSTFHSYLNYYNGGGLIISNAFPQIAAISITSGPETLIKHLLESLVHYPPTWILLAVGMSGKGFLSVSPVVGSISLAWLTGIGHRPLWKVYF